MSWRQTIYLIGLLLLEQLAGEVKKPAPKRRRKPRAETIYRAIMEPPKPNEEKEENK